MLQLSELHYRTGGLVHFIVNNQIVSPPICATHAFASSVGCRQDDRGADLHATATTPKGGLRAGRNHPGRVPAVVTTCLPPRHGHNEGDEPRLRSHRVQEDPTHLSTLEIYGKKLVTEAGYQEK